MKIKVFAVAICLALVFCVFVGCGDSNDSAVSSSQSDVSSVADVVSDSSNTTDTPNDIFYKVDYTKISPMILENSGEEVVLAAKQVITAFLNYENSVSVEVVGNQSLFMNDLGYIINCSCPLFSAFTDFNEVSAYNKNNGTVSWNFLISEDEFKTVTADFTEKIEKMLSVIDKSDSDAMKAVLLYYEVIRGAIYDDALNGDGYLTMDDKEYRLRSSAYCVLNNKSGLCTNISQALMFLYTQSELSCGTVLHMGGAGAHMWNVVKIDEKYYYCDATWDVGSSLNTFGITADDRLTWAGGYSKEDGKMFKTVIAEKYSVDDTRFEILRSKVPVEITKIKTDKAAQTITFEGYEYEYTFSCKG